MRLSDAPRHLTDYSVVSEVLHLLEAEFGTEAEAVISVADGAG